MDAGEVILKLYWTDPHNLSPSLLSSRQSSGPSFSAQPPENKNNEEMLTEERRGDQPD